MIIDARETHYAEIFRLIRSSVTQFYTEQEDFIIFLETDDDQKIRIIMGYVEAIIGCKAELLESSGYYIIRAIKENAVTDSEFNGLERITHG